MTGCAFANETNQGKIVMYLFVSAVNSFRDHLNVKNSLDEKSNLPVALESIAGVAGLMRNKNCAFSQ